MPPSSLYSSCSFVFSVEREQFTLLALNEVGGVLFPLYRNIKQVPSVTQVSCPELAEPGFHLS